MLLLTKKQRMLFRHRQSGEVLMNLDNRRLREIQNELKAYRKLLDETDTMSDRLIYKGKIESLEREEKQILKRNNVEV